jgi:hypothetical protein
MQFDFKATMQSTSTEDLVKIITAKRSNYQQETISAAENELKSRNYSFEILEGHVAKARLQQEIEEERSLKPLGTEYKILAFIFPGVATLIFSGLFKSEGYDKKASDLVKWTFYGIGFYILLALFLGLT